MFGCKLLSTSLFLISLFILSCDAADDGLASSPPMGWRSWNSFGRNINQTIITSVADVFAKTWSDQNSAHFSLVQLGYNDLGLDDNWQSCDRGIYGSFHDKRGNPLINEARFPDMKKMTDYIHKKNMKAGWYFNNCICRESNFNSLAIKGNVNAIRRFGFDSVKLDGCGPYRDLDAWYKEIKATGKPILIENCHWGETIPTETWCPFHMFRTSGDISANWNSMIGNLRTTIKFQAKISPLSRPGCWSYPDMLEVGNMASFNEDRSHFGAWCITSSPLILGFNPLKSDVMKKVLPVISNQEAISVNQKWFGHPGRLLKEYNDHNQQCSGTIQIWGKPIDTKKFAIFMLNDNLSTCVNQVSLALSDLDIDIRQAAVRDIWAQKPLSNNSTNLKFHLEGRDSKFLMLTKIY